MTTPTVEYVDPSIYWHRCANPTSDQTIPDNRLITAHSLECDDMLGIAQELLDGWLQSDIASVHTLADRGDRVAGMQLENVAYHCGSGNQHGTGHEMVGRAAYSFEQWTTPTMVQALRQQAKAMAFKWVHVTIPQYGLGNDSRPEWLSLSQVGDGSTCGLCTHNDMRLVYGGTTHTDPGPNFPYQMLRDFIHAECDALLGTAAAPTISTPVITPPPTDWLTTVDKQEVSDLLDQRIQAALTASFPTSFQVGGKPYSVTIKSALGDLFALGKANEAQSARILGAVASLTAPLTGLAGAIKQAVVRK